MAKEIRKPRRNVQLSLDYHARLKVMADKRRVTLKVMIEIMIEEFEKSE
jgi:macrodomain Ter protein organizer (MatP/YcbG family)